MLLGLVLSLSVELSRGSVVDRRPGVVLRPGSSPVAPTLPFLAFHVPCRHGLTAFVTDVFSDAQLLAPPRSFLKFLFSPLLSIRP